MIRSYNIKSFFLFVQLALIIVFINLLFYSCENEQACHKCPPYDIVPESPYDDPIWHPSGKIIGFNHTPIKEINYSNGYDCPHQANYIYEEDSAGFWLIDSDGNNQRRVLPNKLITPAWSPDGKWIAFSKEAQICIMPFDGYQFDTNAIKQLTNEGRNFYPSWSPNGEWIAYDSNNESSEGYFIWKMRRDGASKTRIAYTPEDGEARAPFWSNDSSIVHYRYIGIGSPEIFKMDSSGNNVVRITDNNITEKYPRSSPNNQFIAYVSQSKLELWKINLFSKEVNLVTKGCNNYSFSSKGEIVYLNYDYSRIDEAKGTLWIMDLNGNNKRQLTYNSFKEIQ